MESQVLFSTNCKFERPLFKMAIGQTTIPDQEENGLGLRLPVSTTDAGKIRLGGASRLPGTCRFISSQRSSANLGDDHLTACSAAS
jgi:hypothetical protein